MLPESVGFDLVHQFHRLDDADGFTLLDRLPDLDERFRVRRGGTIEGADHRRLDGVPRLRRRRGRRRALGGHRRRGGRRARPPRRAAQPAWAGARLTWPPFAMRTFSSPSVISSSAMPDSCTRSMSFFSLRRSMGGSLFRVLAAAPQGARTQYLSLSARRSARARCRAPGRSPGCRARRSYRAQCRRSRTGAGTPRGRGCWTSAPR